MILYTPDLTIDHCKNASREPTSFQFRQRNKPALAQLENMVYSEAKGRCLLASFATPSISSVEKGGKQGQFRIYLANCAEQKEAVDALVARNYGWRGYSVDSSSQYNPNRITLTVEEVGGQMIGTMAPCLDGPVGLPADEDFRDILDELRSQGRKLAEASKLAIDENAPKRTLAALSHLSHIFAHNMNGLSDWVIVINPRHVSFYIKMLGFRELGVEKTCRRVNAPGVLLILDMDHMARQIKEYGGLMEKSVNERSLYPYFFSGAEEAFIERKLCVARVSLRYV